MTHLTRSTWLLALVAGSATAQSLDPGNPAAPVPAVVHVPMPAAPATTQPVSPATTWRALNDTVATYDAMADAPAPKEQR